MSKILLVVGSARPGRVADKVLGYIQEEIAKREGIEATVAEIDVTKMIVASKAWLFCLVCAIFFAIAWVKKNGPCKLVVITSS